VEIFRLEIFTKIYSSLVCSALSSAARVNAARMMQCAWNAGNEEQKLQDVIAIIDELITNF